MSALDNSVDRHAPRINNPVPPTDENLIAGLKLYTMNCASATAASTASLDPGEIVLSSASESHLHPPTMRSGTSST